MKPELNDIIKNNPALFSTEELPDGHHDRFLSRLKESKQEQVAGNKKFPIGRYLSIIGLAASVILIIILIRDNDKNIHESRFSEAATYFSVQLRNTADQIRMLTTHIDPSYRQDLLEDIETLSELNLESVPENINEDERIGILFDQYDARVSSLKMIENSLSQIK